MGILIASKLFNYILLSIISIYFFSFITLSVLFTILLVVIRNRILYHKRGILEYRTKYIVKENGFETEELEIYATGPYVEFEKQDKKILRVRFYYDTLAGNPLFVGIYVSLIIEGIASLIYFLYLDQTTITHFKIDPYQAISFVNLVTNIFYIFVVFIALFLSILIREKSCEFIFDKSTDCFTKNKIIIITNKPKIKFEKTVFEIERIDIKALEIGDDEDGITYYWIYLVLKDGKIKFYSTSYKDKTQFLDYTKYLCDFLDIKYNLANNKASFTFFPFQ